MTPPLTPERIAELRDRIGNIRRLRVTQGAESSLVHVTVGELAALLDEVERLREEGDEWRTAHGFIRGLNLELEAERERLRAALKQIGEGDGFDALLARRTLGEEE